MTFTRTSSGLSNDYLFHKVDIIVYVEGGTSYNYTEVLSGSFDDQSIDIAFWQKIFSIFLSAKKIKFKAVGSKHTLKQIADTVIQNKISTVHVTMDRDFENIKGTLKKSSGIFYTFGYSWENDLWQKEVIKRSFLALCPVCQNSVDVETEILSCFENLNRKMRWIVYADFLLNKFDLAFKEFRKKPDGIITVNENGKPKINHSRFSSIVKEAKSGRTCQLTFGKVQLSVVNDCNGHVFDVFGFRLLSYLLRTFCDNAPKLPRMYAQTTAINSFAVELESGNLPEIYNFYKQQFAQI